MVFKGLSMHYSITAILGIASIIFLAHCTQCEPDTTTTCDLSAVSASIDSISYLGDAHTFNKQTGPKKQNPLIDTTFKIVFDVAEVFVTDASYLQGRCENMESTDLTNTHVSIQINLTNGALITIYPSPATNGTMLYLVDYTHILNDSTLIFGDLSDGGLFNRNIENHSNNGAGVFSTHAVDTFKGSLLSFTLSHAFNHETQVYEGCGDGFLRTH